MKRKQQRAPTSSRATPDLDEENPAWDAETFGRALSGEQRRRIIAGKLQPGDVAALRRFVQLTQAEFAEALGISMRTLQNWEQDRTTPDGAGVALLRIAARHPRIIRENISTAA
jgi:DNA-binding transcriptional regulator YiaG